MQTNIDEHKISCKSKHRYYTKALENSQGN